MKVNEENCEQKSCNLLRLHLLLKQKRKDFFHSQLPFFNERVVACLHE